MSRFGFVFTYVLVLFCSRQMDGSSARARRIEVDMRASLGQQRRRHECKQRALERQVNRNLASNVKRDCQADGCCGMIVAERIKRKSHHTLEN